MEVRSLCREIRSKTANREEYPVLFPVPGNLASSSLTFLGSDSYSAEYDEAAGHLSLLTHIKPFFISIYSCFPLSLSQTWLYTISDVDHKTLYKRGLIKNKGYRVRLRLFVTCRWPRNIGAGRRPVIIIGSITWLNLLTNGNSGPWPVKWSGGHGYFGFIFSCVGL